MEFSKSIQSDYQELLKRRARLERRIDRALENACDTYRDNYTAARKAGKTPVSILAEGDSWFRYGVGFAIVYHLEKLLDTEILNLARPGDEIRKMLSGRQADMLRRELKRGPSRNRKFDFLLFSGGGNDLVGEDTFYKWLNDYETGMQPVDVLNKQTLGKALKMIETNYELLIAMRDDLSPKTHVLLHGYDFAFPDGRGVCWLGPWLQPGLIQRKVPPKLRKTVVELFLRRFAALLKRLARKHERVHVVPTQGTLGRKSAWANELHPKDPGFRLMAEHFERVIRDIHGA